MAAANVDARSLLARLSAHKIDSTLRGNWAYELAARQQSRQCRVLLAPALPELGRTCVGGVVLVDGRPVHEGSGSLDARSRVTSSRPAEHLAHAGVTSVSVAADADALQTWMDRHDEGFVVCDAVTELDLAAIGRVWGASTNVLFGGTAGSISVAANSALGWPGHRAANTAGPDRWPTPTLIVCGSLHAGARRQLADLAGRGVTIETVGPVVGPRRRWSRRRAPVSHALSKTQPCAVLISPASATLPVSLLDAEAMADRLGTAVAARVASGSVATLVVIGGDTAAAVIGEALVRVEGLAAVGTPWGRLADRPEMLLVTRSGGFGGDTALSDLVMGRGD